MDQPDTWGAWLRNAEQLRASTSVPIDVFAAIQVDARGLTPFTPLLDRLAALYRGECDEPYWTYQLDDGRTSVTTGNRLRHLTFGQNMANDRACAGEYSHLMFMAADCMLPDDGIEKLLEVDEHVVGAWCPTYGLPTVDIRDVLMPTSLTDEFTWAVTRHRTYGSPTPSFPLHVATSPDVLAFSAAAVMLDREAFRKLRWRWDVDVGMSDDPCLQHDAWYSHRWPVYVRPDVRARHFPEAIGAIETRGHDMTVHRV